MSYEIQLYQHDPLALANRWVTLPSDELRRRAFKAAYSFDHDELCSLTFAHITAFGSAGAMVSDATLRSYRVSIQQFLDYCSAHATAPLRATPGRLWLRQMESTGRSAATVRVRVAGARAMYRALRWATDTTADPFLDVKPAKDLTPPWEKRQPYQHQEIQSLLEVATGPLKLLILLCSHGGLRIGEALDLLVQDIHPKDRVLIVRHGKGGKMRRVVLSQSLLQNVTPYLQREPKTLLIGLKYQCAIKHLRAACTLAKVTYRGWHSMRHYSGTRLMRETGDLDRVARHLGHTDLATARIYAKWSEDSLHSTVGQW